MSEGVQISKRLVAINAASTMVKSLLSFTVFVWISRFFVKDLPAEELKLLPLIAPAILFVPLLTSFMTSGIARFTTEAYARHDQERVTQVTSTMFPLTALGGLAILAVGALIGTYIGPLLNIAPEYVTDARIMFSILLVTAAVRVTILPVMVGVEVRQKFFVMNVVALALEVLRIVLLFVLLFGVSKRVLWLIVVNIPIETITISFQLVYSRRLVPALRFRRGSFRRDLVRQICSFGGYTFISRSAAVIREQLTPVLLSWFTTPIGPYAYHLGAVVERRFYPTAIGPLLALQPALTGMHAVGQQERMRRTFLRMSRYLLWTFLFFGLPGIVFRDNLWRVWFAGDSHEKVADGALVFALLFAKGAFVFSQPILAQVATARGEMRSLCLRMAAIELTGLALSFFFVFGLDMGPVGMALGGVTGSAVLTPLLHWPLGLRLTGASWGVWIKETLLPGYLPGLVALPVWLGLWWFAAPETWYTLFACGLAGCVVYVAAVVGWCLTPGERADLGKALAPLRRRVTAIFGR